MAEKIAFIAVSIILLAPSVMIIVGAFLCYRYVSNLEEELKDA